MAQINFGLNEYEAPEYNNVYFELVEADYDYEPIEKTSTEESNTEKSTNNFFDVGVYVKQKMI